VQQKVGTSWVTAKRNAAMDNPLFAEHISRRFHLYHKDHRRLQFGD